MKAQHIDAGLITNRARSRNYRTQLMCKACRLTWYGSVNRNAKVQTECPGCGQVQIATHINAITGKTSK